MNPSHPPLKKRTIGAAMPDRVVVCDCHYAPMNCEAMVLLPSGKTVMCWVSDCGRYYSRLQGYFHLHGLTEGRYVDSNTRVTRACAGETCAGRRYMGLVSDGLAGQAAYWYCFKCGQVKLETKSTATDRLGAA